MTRLLLSAFVIVTGVALFGTVAIHSQNSPAHVAATPSGTELPDWSGIWVIPFEAFARENALERDPANSSAPRLKPGWVARPPGGCTGPGMPQVMRFAYGMEMLFSPGRVTMLLELSSAIRRIYTDGRAHSDDPDVTLLGESIGHWEGETLVVHTTAISSRAPLTHGVLTSGQTQVTERIRRTDLEHLQIDTVIEDPIVLEAPWKVSRIYERWNGGFFERECGSGKDRDGNDGEPDLTPPR